MENRQKPALQPGQSELDWLWENFGGATIDDDPNVAEDASLLDKRGVTRLIVRMIRNLLRKIELRENHHCPNLLDVVVTEDDGDQKVAFSLEKEDHLKKVRMRKSTQADVDDRNCVEANSWIAEFQMQSGRKHYLDFANFTYQGARTDTVETVVDGNSISSFLRIANSVDSAITVDATRNGLLVQLNVADQTGQVRLVKTKDGLDVRNEWADGTDIRMSFLTYDEYLAMLNADECSCGCGCTGRYRQKGHIYFITDRRYIYLDGVRYGDNLTIRDTETISYEKKANGVAFSLNISGDAHNLAKAIENGLYVGFEWSGVSGHVPVTVWRGMREKYDELTKEQKASAIFYCDDTKQFFVNGIDYSSVEVIGKMDDTGMNTVYGYINSRAEEILIKFNEFSGRVAGIVDKMSEHVDRMQGDLSQLNDNLVNNINILNNAIKTVNDSLVVSVDTINTAITGLNSELDATRKAHATDMIDVRNELKEGLDEKVDWTNAHSDDHPNRKAIVLEQDDIIMSKVDGQSGRVGLLLLTKDGHVSLGTTSKPLNLNGEGVRPTFNNQRGFAFVDELQKISGSIELVQDENDSLHYQLMVAGRVAGELNIPEDKSLKDVSYDPETKILTMVYSVNAEDGSVSDKTVKVDLTGLIDVYTAGDGLAMTGNKMFINIDPESDPIVSVSENGLKISGVNELVDSEANRVNAMVDVINENMKTINDNLVAAVNTINGGIENEVKPAIEEAKDNVVKEAERVNAMINQVNENMQLINQNLVDAVNTINGGINNEIRPEIEAIKAEITEFRDEVFTKSQVDAKIVVERNARTEADKVNEDAIAAEVERAQAKEAELQAAIDNFPSVADVPTDELPDRKAIVLKNGDMILGTSTDGGTYNVAMVNRWDVVDLGTASLPINLNTPAGVRPTVQEAGQSGEQANKIAYVSDIEEANTKIAELTAKIEELTSRIEIIENA